MTVFWVVAPCSLVEVFALIMEAARASETLLNFYQTTRCYSQKDSHLRAQRRENLKSFFFPLVHVSGIQNQNKNVCQF
jgi:hypothetical protein